MQVTLRTGITAYLGLAVDIFKWTQESFATT